MYNGQQQECNLHRECKPKSSSLYLNFLVESNSDTLIQKNKNTVLLSISLFRRTLITMITETMHKHNIKQQKDTKEIPLI
jgi:hypothetical protein